MVQELNFSLSYEVLLAEAETLIRDITASSHLPIMRDDMTRCELRAVIRFWSHAAASTGCPELIVGRDQFRLQKVAGLPEGNG